MAKKVIPQTDIFNYKSKEFLLNLNPKDIPPKSSLYYDDFILHEEEKSAIGVNINGIHIPGSLYFELNHWKIKLDVLDKYGNIVKEIGHPKLKDNSWIIHSGFDEASKQKLILIIGGGRQIQKELPDYETLITPNGKVCISNLKVGSVVYGKDGKETFVLGVYPQGVKPIYRMTLLDGRTIDCGHEHLWEVFKGNRTKKIMTTKELIDFGIKTKHSRSGFNYNFYIDEVKPVQFSKKELPIDPYILGALIGDGGCTMGTNTINTIDEEIINKFKEKLPDYEFKPENYTYKGVTQNCKHTIVYRGKKQMFNKNPLNQELIKLGLKIKSYKKFIPEVYKWSSVEDRYELIRGLFDTDGSINNKGSIEFKTSSKILAEDVMWVLRSLGIKCQLGITDVRNTKMKMPNNKSYICNKLYYRVYVNTDKPIFNLTRKLEKLKIKKTTNRVGISSIEYIGEHSATCITVDNEDSLYLTKDFIPTHNTTTITSLLGRQITLFPNTFSLGLFSNSKDQEVNAGYLETGLENLEYLKIPRLDKNWKTGLIRLGYKQIDNTDEVWSTLYMRNTDEGKNTEVGAGTTLNFFVFDEIAKSPVSKAMEAVKPAMISEFGRRGASVYCFTGGDVLKSKDAENLFLNPKANDVLEFENEGKKTGLFLGGWYRQDFKKEQTLSDYLKVKTNSELDEIKIQVTDFDLANSTLDKEQELLRTDPDKSKLLKHKMYYPRSIREMFLSENENPFPREALEQQKQFLLANPIGQNIELFRGANGKVQFKFSQKIPIPSYPVVSGTNLDAPIVMYDSPEKFKGQKGIHVISCLPSGEKVMTGEGLKNIESVSLKDKLINSKGDLVSIQNKQIKNVENEDIYKLNLANTFRTTSFTKEHPILVSKGTMKYISYNKCKRLGVKQRYRQFDFEFKKAKDLIKNDWVKIPNLYKKEIIPDYDFLWNDFECSNCKKMSSPLEDKDFWWLIGLYLGDGWLSNIQSINIVFNKKETYYIDKFKKVCEKLFNKIPTFVKEQENAITYSLYSKQLNRFIFKNLGVYSKTKKISEWIKYLPKEYKLELIKGYLNSDGCVLIDSKKRGITNFVSINLEMLESIQDILFSLGIIGSLQRLRKASVHFFRKQPSNTQECYSLNICFSETYKLLSLLYEENDHKTSKLKKIKNVHKSDSGCRFDELQEYVYLQITNIEKSKYTGLVYNFECDTHTFCSHHITTHNCDVFNDDEAPNSDSLGSIYVFRKFHSDLSDHFNGCMVASYTARPKTMKEYNEIALMLTEFYDGQIMYEHTGGAFKDFFESKNKLHLLIDTPSLTKEISPNSKAGNTKGLRATVGIQKHALNLSLDYCNEDLIDGKLGVTRILDPVLIEELLAYDGSKNVDRYIAFSMGMEALYMYKKYTTIVNYQTEEESVVDNFVDTPFGMFRRKGNTPAISNPFNLNI